jgi:hypothetical protein
MKKYLLHLLLFGALATYGQAPACLYPTPLNEEIKQMLAPLDKSQIPNGVLYESVFPWAALLILMEVLLLIPQIPSILSKPTTKSTIRLLIVSV